MSAAAPWSVKGIEPKAREIAKDLARRSGMTLGEWLNTMIMDDEDDGVQPLPRRPAADRPHIADMFERRGRSRRLDDAYDGSDDVLQRVAASVEAIAARLEGAERRSTVAIQGVDQAVAGLVRRLDGQETTATAQGRRLDDIAEELREGHRRLRRFEQEVAPQTAETFAKVETSISALASRFYDIEERQRTGANELRQRMDAAEKAAGPGVGSEILAQVSARLDTAQAQTTEALRSLERSFAGLDQRMRATEGRVEPEGAREAARFEKLAETLARQVEGNRVEMLRRLDTAETENRVERIERAVLSIGDQIQVSERSGAQAVEAMGREVLRIAQNLNNRVRKVESGEGLEALTRTLGDKVERDMGRLADTVEQRLIRADDQHALAIEKLGGEISRISDRLTDRIAQSERRSAQALEEIGERLVKSSEKIEQRHDRASGELAERMRLSEERTAQLLAGARDSLEQRGPTIRREAPLEAPVDPAPADDWRTAAFPDVFDNDAAWALDGAEAPAPFPGTAAPAPALVTPLETPVAPVPTTRLAAASPAAPVVLSGFGRAQTVSAPTADPAVDPVFEAVMQPPATEPLSPFGAASASFGGADVSDALAATDPDPGRDEDYAAETDFIDPRSLRAASTVAGRSAGTRDTIEAARAAMTASTVEAPRQGFSLRLNRGGKSKLQERLDKQASRDGSTVKKALLASVTAVALTGAVIGYTRLTDQVGIPFPGSGSGSADGSDTVLAAVALTPTDRPTQGDPETAALYAAAVEQLDAGEATAVEALTRVANLGYAPAQFHLARLYEAGDGGLTEDPVEARTWTLRAAEGGEAGAMHNLALYLFDGIGGRRNQVQAARWFERAAQSGLTDSQYNLARLYEDGADGVPADSAEAYKWYLIAARAGDAQAEAAAERLAEQVPAGVRRTARTAADTFTPAVEVGA